MTSGGNGYPDSILSLTPDATTEDSKRIFNQWASTYEQGISNAGYQGHRLCVQALETALTELVPSVDKGMKIMDAGAGTGLIGEFLNSRGFTNLDALDISLEMLNIAEQKNVYKQLICAPLTGTRIPEVETGQYDALLCAGTFAVGQAKAEALPEVARQVKPGGLVIFTIRADTYDAAELGYSSTCESLERDNIWELISRKKTELHTTPDAPRYRYGYVITYKVLKN